MASRSSTSARARRSISTARGPSCSSSRAPPVSSPRRPRRRSRTRSRATRNSRTRPFWFTDRLTAATTDHRPLGPSAARTESGPPRSGIHRTAERPPGLRTPSPLSHRIAAMRLPRPPAMCSLLLFGVLLVSGCAHRGTDAGAPVAQRIPGLLPADALLLGEQHDADAHHAIEAQVVEVLATRGRLAALAIEMAEQGNETAHLPPTASEEQVRTALGWNEDAWPWRAYDPAIMAAVRAGAPVI